MLNFFFLLIFWKPLYWSCMYIYNKFYIKEDILSEYYFNSIKEWGWKLWSLVWVR